MRPLSLALLPAAAAHADAGNLLKNGGFESGTARPPDGWTLDGKSFGGFGGTFRDSLPKHSVTVYEMEAEQTAVRV